MTNDVVDALRDQLAELDSMVSDLDDEGWAKPSACPGWSVRDVLVHLAQTNEAAIASVEGGREKVAAMWTGATAASNVDELAALAVEGVDLTGPDVLEWWKRTARDMAAAFESCDPRARVPWVVGEMAAQTLCTTRLSETWIHTTDIAVGLAVELAPTDRLWHVARLVHRTLPYAFDRDGREPPGPIRFELTAAEDPSQMWTFGDAGAATLVTGPAIDLCRVAGQRAGASDTALEATGPDSEAVLALMRTFA